MKERKEFHFFTILMLGMSASIVAVGSRRIEMPLIWLAVIFIFTIITNPGELSYFLRRLAKIGTVLLGISLLQIIFRRSGIPVFSYGNTILIYSDGLLEAALVWIRFMILFVLANIMSRVSIFNFLLFTNKIRLSLNFGLLLLMTVKLLPFIFKEAKRVLWFFRFRGLSFRGLSLTDKAGAVKQLIFALLMRCIDYVFNTALALELRGFGQEETFPIPRAYPLGRKDIFTLVTLGLVNVVGFFVGWF